MSESKTAVISKDLHMICKQVALDAGVKLETVINTAIAMSLKNKELYKKLKRA
jgi:hypothetical protein